MSGNFDHITCLVFNGNAFLKVNKTCIRFTTIYNERSVRREGVMSALLFNIVIDWEERPSQIGPPFPPHYNRKPQHNDVEKGARQIE